MPLPWFLPFNDAACSPCSLVSLRILTKCFLKCSCFLTVKLFQSKQFCIVRIFGSQPLTCRKLWKVCKLVCLVTSQKDPPFLPCSKCSLLCSKYSQRSFRVFSYLLLSQDFLVESEEWPKIQLKPDKAEVWGMQQNGRG